MVTRSTLIALVIASSACAPSKPRAARVTDSPENQALLAKLRGYVLCLDEYAPRVFEIADDYLSRFGDRQPTPDVLALVSVVPDPKPCFEGLAEARKLPPQQPTLDTAGAAFARAYEAVYALIKEAHDRFDRKHPAYDPVKGVAMHGPLLAAFREFDRTQGPLFDEVRRLDLGVRRDQLTRTEQREGRTLQVLIDWMMLRGEELIAIASTPTERLEQLDVAAAGAMATAFEDTLAEAAAARRSVDPADTEPDVLVLQARRFLIAARQMISRARDKLAFTDAERIMLAAANEPEVVGTPAALAAAYNKLIEAYYAR
jgi:hypothetical protein